jgi:hypothetical protein
VADTHQVVFYPVANGDTTQIILSAGRRVLFDFCHRGNAEDDDTPEIDLSARSNAPQRRGSLAHSDFDRLVLGSILGHRACCAHDWYPLRSERSSCACESQGDEFANYGKSIVGLRR